MVHRAAPTFDILLVQAAIVLGMNGLASIDLHIARSSCCTIIEEDFKCFSIVHFVPMMQGHFWDTVAEWQWQTHSLILHRQAAYS